MPRRTCRSSHRLATSATPVNWLAPPESTTRCPPRCATGTLVQAIGHEFKYFIDARPDDARQHGARNLLHRVDPALAEQRHGQHLPFIGACGKGAAPQGFHPLRMGDRCRQAARDIIGDMHAANRNAVGKHQVSLMENAEMLVVAPPISIRTVPEHHFIFRQHGLAGRIGRNDIACDRKMGPLNGQGQVSQMGGVGGDDAQLNTQAFPVHSKGRRNALGIIKLILDRRQMQHRAARRIDLRHRRCNDRIDIARDLRHFLQA